VPPFFFSVGPGVFPIASTMTHAAAQSCLADDLLLVNCHKLFPFFKFLVKHLLVSSFYLFSIGVFLPFRLPSVVRFCALGREQFFAGLLVNFPSPGPLLPSSG
jgi:hypothetical protein